MPLHYGSLSDKIATDYETVLYFIQTGVKAASAETYTFLDAHCECAEVKNIKYVYHEMKI